ncbi:MAG: EAL domain-containing protein [Ruminococcaceae bacterium]|nr:EAL domain-containing protein [Oscillospiraceae bacterium]
MNNPLKLADVLGLKRLQQLQDTFASAVQVATVLVDHTGQPLVPHGNAHGFCALIHGTPCGMDKCTATYASLCAENKATGKMAVASCPYSGLTVAAEPLMLDDQYLGSWVIGQLRTNTPDKANLAQTAEALQLPLDELTALYDAIPPTSPEALQQIFKFLAAMSQTLVELGNDSVRMAARNEELKHLTGRYERTAAMLQKYTDSSELATYISDYDTGEILMVNRQFCKVFACGEGDVLGKKCWDVAGTGQGSFCFLCPRARLLDTNFEPTPPYTWEYENTRIGAWLRCSNQVIQWVDGRQAHMVTFLDVTGEHLLHEELTRLAFYDRQLSLPNSQKLVADLIKQADIQNQYLITFDIASLRSINDAYGREVGDVLLETVVDWVDDQSFGYWQLYRVEGDEFCLHFVSCTDTEALEVATRIYDRFQESWHLSIQARELAVICGVAVSVIKLHPDLLDDSILSLMERTLDTSRQNNNITVYDERMDAATKEHIRLQIVLKNCVKNNMSGFDVHYQPIVDPAAGKWRGMEALCRWINPETGTAVPPLEFITETEQMGLIDDVGIWVMETAVRQCKAWGLDALDGFFLSVNLSPVQLMDGSLYSKVNQLLKEYDYPGECLSLEITESAELPFNSYTIDVIEKLRFRGINISLDDFGTGYSSFSNLKNLPVSTLKTEREFIVGVEDDYYMQYFFHTMAELAHAADMKLVAEGVETREQLEIILKNGADYVQGYYFSRPLSSRELEKQLFRYHQVDPDFYAVHNAIVTEDSVSPGMEGYMASPRLFQVLTQCMQLMLAGDSLDATFANVLHITGDFFEVSHAFLFRRANTHSYRQMLEWRRQGAVPISRLRYNRHLGDPGALLDEQFTENGMVVTSDVARLPDLLRGHLEELGFKSAAILPMVVDGETIGFVGFGNQRYREWLPEEIMLIRNLCLVMGESTNTDQLQKQVRQSNTRLSYILNTLDMDIVVADPDSREVLWANDHARQKLGGSLPASTKCHQLLRGNPQPCSFCRADHLRHGPVMRQFNWDHHDDAADKDYHIHNSFIRWENNQPAILEYAMDITTIKKAQRELEFFASVDMLTGTANRNSLIATFRAVLKAAAMQLQPMAIVFIDVDGLKAANDTFGHSFGDILIKNTVTALRARMRPQDTLGRYGGDEFVLLMPGCDFAQATQKMEAARQHLSEMRIDPFDESYTFSYGVVESTELPYQDSDRLVNAFINIADDRMRDYKKTAAAAAERSAKAEGNGAPPPDA